MMLGPWTLEDGPVEATFRPPRRGGSGLVPVYLRPVKGSVGLTQTCKERMLPAEGAHETGSADFGKINKNWYLLLLLKGTATAWVKNCCRVVLKGTTQR